MDPLQAEFRQLVRKTMLRNTRSTLLILDYIHHPIGVRQDAGASIRAKIPDKTLDKTLDNTTDKYHKLDTQYIGTHKGLTQYEHFIKHAPELVNDQDVREYMKGAFYVENGIVAGFQQCRSCTEKSNEPFCGKCLAQGKHKCDTCHQLEDPRRMVNLTCETCHLKEIVHCHTCKKKEPRGHACILPIIVNYMPEFQSGRPRQQKYVNIKGKKHILCTLGCKPGTFIGMRSWKRHVGRKHSIGIHKFKCRRCKYKCNDISQFKRHKLTHSDKRNFVCNICQRTYKQSEGLYAHKKKCH